MKKKYASLVLAAMLTLGGTGLANASNAISYIATDLADVTLGEDLWQYTYTVTGDSFAPGTGFAIEFASLQASLAPDQYPAVPAGWSAFTYNSNDVVVYDVQALPDNTGNVFLTESLIVDFVRVEGAGAPASQNFYVYGTDLVPTAYGVTTAAPVPVPGAIWLLGAGLAAIASVGRRKKN